MGGLHLDHRTPQVNILSAMHLFEQKNPQWQENLEYQKLSAQIKKNAHETINFARDIVEFSQVRNEQIHLEEHNLGHLIHFAYEKTHIQAQNKRIQINRQFEERYEQWAWACVDGELIERAIINLITNAIRYSPQDSQITLGLAQSSEHIIVTVADQGVGMDKELVAQLLNRPNNALKPNDALKKTPQPNQSTQPDAAGSMVLGWRMILAIIDKHEGHIDIKAHPHLGTQISIFLKKPNNTNK